jgi:hypothetical protein
MFNSQAYYYKEQQVNFKALSNLLLYQRKQDLKHCDTINCCRDSDTKVVYLRNIVNNQIIEQKLCRDCRVEDTRSYSIHTTILAPEATEGRSIATTTKP